jgi:hypothetical protein
MQRSTARSTAERLLEAFQDLRLTLIRQRRRRRCHLTPLSRVQQCILTPLDFPWISYMRFFVDSRKPPNNERTVGC